LAPPQPIDRPPQRDGDHSKDNGQRLLARDTGARHVVVPDAGHYLQLERPELVIAAAQDVLQQVRR
jgi:pimeloyl-ACP methyl ester carboxylesterase